MDDRETNGRRRSATRLHVILIAYHYHPDPAVGSLRARNVAKALTAAGHDVDVVTAAMPGQPAEAMDDAVRVHRVEPGASPRSLLVSLKHLVRRPKAAAEQRVATAAAEPGNAWTKPTRVSTLKRWIGAITWLPDDHQGFVLPAARKARALVRGDGSDVLYSTAPPRSDQLIGLVLGHTRRLRWVMEFRDPWTDDGHKPWFVRSKATDAAERWMERRAMTTSDGVVTVTRAYADVLIGRYGDMLARKLAVIRNGVPKTFAPAPLDPSVFRIVYAGSFYLGRDPKIFFDALARLHASGKTNGRRIQVQLIGDCRFFEGEALEAVVAQLGLANVVEFVSWMPHAQTVDLMRQADLLLLLAQHQPLAVPNKLYEYVGMGRPVLAFADDRGETARLLREIGGHLVVTERDDAAAVERMLADAIAAPVPYAGESPTVAAMATSVQMAELVRWLERLPART